MFWQCAASEMKYKRFMELFFNHCVTLLLRTFILNISYPYWPLSSADPRRPTRRWLASIRNTNRQVGEDSVLKKLGTEPEEPPAGAFVCQSAWMTWKPVDDQQTLRITEGFINGPLTWRKTKQIIIIKKELSCVWLNWTCPDDSHHYHKITFVVKMRLIVSLNISKEKINKWLSLNHNKKVHRK